MNVTLYALHERVRATAVANRCTKEEVVIVLQANPECAIISGLKTYLALGFLSPQRAFVAPVSCPLQLPIGVSNLNELDCFAAHFYLSYFEQRISMTIDYARSVHFLGRHICLIGTQC